MAAKKKQDPKELERLEQIHKHMEALKQQAVAYATENPKSWARLVEAKEAESRLRSATKSVKELRAIAGAAVLEFQKRFGDSKELLTALADHLGYNVASLYRWKRVALGKPATKPAPGPKKQLEIMRQEFDSLKDQYHALVNEKEERHQLNKNLTLDEQRILNALLYGRVAEGHSARLRDAGVTAADISGFKRVVKILVPAELKIKMRVHVSYQQPVVMSERLLPEYAESLCTNAQI